jgi:transposase
MLRIGYLDEMKKIYDNPIAHFEAIAAKMTEERKAEDTVTISLNMKEQIPKGKVLRKNYGHVVFSKVYHELELDIFLKNARRHKNFKFNNDSIMRLLVFARLLRPCSKRATVLMKDEFFDNFKFSLDDVYNCLTHFDLLSDSLQQHLHDKVTEQYKRNTDLVYYDVTNYYFEIDKQDELRRKGAEKNNRKDPIVQMGLLLDSMSLPISYKLFPGNTHDFQTLMPILTNLRKKFGAKRMIIVADKALNSGDNIAYHTILGDGYVYSKSIRGASEDFKAWVLDEEGYQERTGNSKGIGNNFKGWALEDEANQEELAKAKIKSKLVPDAVINVTVEQIGKKKKKKKETVEQKWVVLYSPKFAARAKRKREEAINKARDMIKNPSKYKRTYDYGAAGYIKNLKVNKETGEIMNIEDILLLDDEKIAEDEKYDGYYAIVTSEMDDTDEHILEMYSGLWQIEESFKVTKSVLGTRPIHLSTPEHINAHFLICFIALLIGRVIEMRLGRKYTIERIAESLKKVAATNVAQNIWTFDYADEVTDDMNAVFGTDFGLKNMTLQNIKKSLGEAKKAK